MLKKLLNQATIELTIAAQGPLLIKSGIEGGADPSVPDMQFVRSDGQVYLPGSSLKGVFRSYAEKIARTVGAKCCNPFDDTFCGKKANDAKVSSGAAIYSNRNYACRVCQLFGSTAMASRIKLNDAYLPNEQNPLTETRTGVAIDRVLGSVAHGPFDFEVVTRGTFKTSIHLRNFELWQLGLLALVLRDLEEGLIPIGFGKSRGLGEVKAQVTSLNVRYIGAQHRTDQAMFPNGQVLNNVGATLCGIGFLAADDQERKAYGLSAKDAVTLETAGSLSDDGLGVSITFDETARREVFRKCVNERWREVAQNDRSSN
jgi:CRISPR-associated RAMP protein (TIGR02581 family)